MVNKIIKFVTGKTEKEVNKKMSKDRPNVEGLKITGGLKLTGRNKDGSIAFIKEQKNLITDAGFDLICDCLGKNAQPSDITHMAIGSGVAGNAASTTLTSEDQRETATYAHTPGEKTCTFTANFTTIVAATEYGLFNDGTTGSMLNTAGFSAITVDSLEIVATLTLS